MFGWGLPNYRNSNPQQDDALPYRERASGGSQAFPGRLCIQALQVRYG